MKTYFALTIGPIFKTMEMARETRELWAASYIFSHLMECLVAEFDTMGDMVLPVKPTLVKYSAVKIKPGLYPDRLIVRLDEKNYKTNLNKKVEKVKEDFFESLLPNDINAKTFLIKYFHVHSLRIDLPEIENPVQTINDLLDSCELSPAYVEEYDINYVENLLNDIKSWTKFKELFGEGFRFPSVIEIATNDLKNTVPDKTISALEQWIFNQNEALQKIIKPDILSKIKKDGNKGKTVCNWSFDFVLESEKAIQDALKKNTIVSKNQPQRVDLIKLLKNAYNPEGCKKEDETFRNYHKYMAIVQADGDNLSKAIAALYNTGGLEAVQHISSLLMKFGNEASKKISEFGGIPIYMGGDDLLFFAPVRNKEKSLFHLIQELDILFNQTILSDKKVLDGIDSWNASVTKENKRKKITLYLSFGISIAYYKYPLWESLETARANLFEVAKNFPGKNAISFKVLKHSGQHYEALFAKNWRSYKEIFLDLINEVIAEKPQQVEWQKSEKKIVFLSSLQHKLDPLRPILYRLLAGRKVDPGKAGFLEAFLNYIPDEYDREFKTERLRENFFNEKIHKREGTDQFFKLSFAYLLQVYRDMEDVYGNSNETAEKAVDALYATLRFIQFLIQPDHSEIN